MVKDPAMNERRMMVREKKSYGKSMS